MSRPTAGPAMVNHLPGSDHARERLTLILQTIAGEISVKDAAQKLGISETRFFDLRTAALQASLAELEPKPVGRPKSDPPETTAPPTLSVPLVTAPRELTAEERFEIRFQAHGARLREEIALVFPHLVEGGKKNKKRRRR